MLCEIPCTDSLVSVLLPCPVRPGHRRLGGCASECVVFRGCCCLGFDRPLGNVGFYQTLSQNRLVWLDAIGAYSNRRYTPRIVSVVCAVVGVKVRYLVGKVPIMSLRGS